MGGHLDDPHTWATPWTFTMNLTEDESQPPFEYACHEGNYGLRNILTAARAEEKGGGGIEQMKVNMARLASGICAGAVMMVVAAAQSSAQSYKAPKTPWGDPDIQGNYTNLTEAGTPLERPKEFEGKQLSEISAEELRTLKRQAAERTINNFLGPTEAPDNWWQVAYRNAENGAQAWLVIDPPDGKIPPLTPEAQQRQQAAAEARKRNTRGPADSYTDRSLYDRCITRGFPNSGMPTIYGNSSQIVQGPGYVAITYEMIHDTRVIPHHVGTASGDEHPIRLR